MRAPNRGCLTVFLMLIGLLVFWSMTARVSPIKVLLLNRRIKFVGRVVDQFGQPVPNAKITIHFGQFVPIGMYGRITEDTYTTDRNGYFSIRWRVGDHLLVTKIEKKGYEYSSVVNTDVTSWNCIQPQSPERTWEAPALFRLRKRGETAHLMHGEYRIGFDVEESGIECGFDLIREAVISSKALKSPTYRGEPLCCDFLYKGIWNDAEKTWSMVFSAGTPGGGVMLSDQILYTAPETGYQPSVTLAPTGEPPLWARSKQEQRDHPGLRYLYVRSRAPYVYARIDLGGRIGFDVNDRPFVRRTEARLDKCFLSTHGAYVINPYGDRALDDEPELPTDTRLKLDEGVRKAYRFNVNGRPPRPDIPRLIPKSSWCWR